MKTFCQSCGSGVDYPSVRPNFCPHCGTSMAGGRPVVASQSSRPQPVRRPAPSYQPPVIEYYDDEEEVLIGGVDFKSRNLPERPQPVLGEHVFGTGSSGLDRRPKMKAKEFKDFAKKMHTEKPKPTEID